MSKPSILARSLARVVRLRAVLVPVMTGVTRARARQATCVAIASLLGASAVLSGCASTQVTATPMAVMPMPRVANVQTAGSIYQPTTATNWFETPVAHRVGDLLTIAVSENSTGSSKSQSDTSRSASATAKSAKADGADSVLERWFNIGQQASSFKGNGTNTSSSALTGTIAVAIVEVLPNGAYVVGGEKQVMQGRNMETFRFTGVVNKFDISPANVVASSKVGQAKVARVDAGQAADGSNGGWLQSILLDVSPF
ncbi:MULTISPECIES: flagellar basal body L-ring protein FlgH [Pandoraea]|uniref:flagellar basal body L-ring protein FlgH n=1 Tax=Pandoraea TaxID=93217 RepID=UPI001F5CD25A|nr:MULTISPECIES: flagellar basal body L-ring protein FlgH [Pandoraea]MCI3206985.1 flagellar biosynthesis protein FlgH [Pandoraea sp. LA3]MDN4585013.1 flagellar biosynthesis protein FlgH [Pandoraea capi]